MTDRAEHPEDPATIPAEPADEITPIQLSATTTTNPEPETMEVHKHPHHVTHKKKWGEYLLEFLMLFLAVFLGFVAENYREHLVEIEREKQYIHSLIEDVRTDITQINYDQGQLSPLIKRLDSIIEKLGEDSNGSPSVNCYRQISIGFGFSDFIYNDGTMQQLKNSGGMRLIRNLKVANSIINYDQSVRRTLAFQDIINNTQLPRMVDKINSLIDISKMKKLVSNSQLGLDTINIKNAILLSHDANELTRFVNQLKQYSYSIYYQMEYLTNNREKGIQLLSLLKKDYVPE